MNFEEVRPIALALPGAKEGTSYGTPAFFVRRKLFARLREDGDSLLLRCNAFERKYLLDDLPNVFYITDHYRDGPCVLVRLSAATPALLRERLEASWRIAAPKKLVAELEGAPRREPCGRGTSCPARRVHRACHHTPGGMMHARSLRPLLAVAGLITLGASCAKAQDKPRIDTAGIKPMDTTPWIPPSIVDRQGRQPDYAAFGLDLFRRLAEAKPNENVIVSPLSVGLAVSMLANGATGGTRAGIERTLAEGSIDALNPANAALAAALRTDDVELAVANSLWAREGIPFHPAFLQQNREFYGAEIQSLNLSTPEAARRINEWASRSTRGRITEMVDGPLDGDVILYLMNAVYFKGRWKDEFRPQATRPRTFHAPGGDVQRPMMSRTDSYGYLQGEGFQAVRLPYRGDRFAMYVLLPDSGQSLAQLRGRLTADAWRGWMGTFRPREVRLTMPRYRMSLESRLNSPLEAMGMAEAFSQTQASFRNMLAPEFLQGRNVYVSEAKQKVFIEVNEEGTEAAAVTGVEVRTTSAPPPPVEFTVDRPFVVAIRDDQTGALLFVGQVNDPVTQ